MWLAFGDGTKGEAIVDHDQVFSTSCRQLGGHVCTFQLRQVQCVMDLHGERGCYMP